MKDEKYIYYPINKWAEELSFIETYDKFKIDETSLYFIENIDDYSVYLMEKLGNANVLDKYSNLIYQYIISYLKDGGRKQDLLVMKLIIKELGINQIHIEFSNKPTSIKKSNNKLYLSINFPLSHELQAEIDHELQHIYINERGNITKNEYFICNDLIRKTTGKTKAFLTLYYLSFKDEISANIHMFHRQIGINKIKNKEFLINHQLYNIAVNRMIPISEKIDSYKESIIDEGFEILLVKEFGKSLDTILNMAEKQIFNAGEEYKRKLAKCL